MLLALWCAVVLTVAILAGIVFLYLQLPGDMARFDPSPSARPWPSRSAAIAAGWDVIKGEADSGPVGGSLAERFRFAGAFFVSGGGDEELRRAVVDEIAARCQHIVSEGDQFGDVRVSRIYGDRIVLSENGLEEELWLSLAGARVADGGDSGSTTGAVAVATENRFGKMVSENNWQFKRDALMAYYDELMDEPQRLLQVFDSLKPLRNENGKIQGYELDVEGEQAFFDDIGFREGDVVRRVNSMMMTSRRRAEFFIHQFVDNKLSVVLIDVERDGKKQRLTYRIR